MKVDVVNKKTVSWAEEGAMPSEPVFISPPGPENQAEDEGKYCFYWRVNDESIIT